MKRFITAYRLYLIMKMKDATVEKQIQQVLLYIERESANIQKENLLKDLKSEEIEFGSTGNFLLKLRKEFGEEDKELVKVAKLRKIEQRRKTIRGK